MFILSIYAFIFVIDCGLSRDIFDKKSWIPDTNFDNPNNWDSEILPCENSRVIFPSNSRLVSLLSSPMSVSELVLPLDGQLVFGSNAELTLTGGVAGSTCNSQDVHFVVPNLSWYDPNNWNVSSWRATPSSSSGDASVVPHAYRVPCRTDDVIFSPGKSFKVHIDGSPTVAKMSINGMDFDNEDIKNFLVSQTGNFLFPGNPQITIEGNECSNPSGCTCGNDEPQVMEVICKYKRCPTPLCSDPFQPPGHCCQICGSFFIMEYRERFQLERLLILRDSSILKWGYHEIHSYAGKTYEDKIQVILVDGGENKGMAADVAQDIYMILSKDIKNDKSYNLESLELHSSVKWNAGVFVHGKLNQGEGMSPMSAGGIVGILFAVAIIVGAVFAALYFYRKRYVPGFSFARFDLNIGKVELELGTTPHDELEPDEPSSAVQNIQTEKAFDNPIYGQSGAQAQTADGSSESLATDGEFVENPMFMIYPENSESSKS